MKLGLATSTEDAFMRRHEPEPNSGCWLWTGAASRSRKGSLYGNLRVHGGKDKPAHRFSYEMFVGPIPQGRTIDHICRTTLCVNPRHLEVVSMRENILRGDGPAAVNARRTLCQNGHPFSVDNRGARVCRVCESARQRRYRARKLGAS